MGFADCKETAIRVSGEIPDSEIYYGLYVATTPKKTWDKGWRKAPDPVFTHFWVVKDNDIIDHATDQFGGPDVSITTIDDPHYVTVGVYNPINDSTTTLVSDPFIQWPLLTEPGGSVSVIWRDFDKYMKQFK